MFKKLIIAFYVVFVAPSLPVYAAGLPKEISFDSLDKKSSLNTALEWLKGETELPKELRKIPVSVTLMKLEEEVVAASFQVNAITQVFKKHNKALDNGTASEYANIIKSESEKYGEDPFVIAALIVVESTVKHDALSKGGDFGLMQVRWKVHKNRLMQKYPTIKTENDMFRPKVNIMAGTEIFSNYRKSAAGDIEKAMVAYSGGSSTHWGKVDKVVSQMRIRYEEYFMQ